MDVHEVVNLLTFLINTNGKRHLDAQSKWLKDLEFVQGYKVKPQGTVFASNIK